MHNDEKKPTHPLLTEQSEDELLKLLFLYCDLSHPDYLTILTRLDEMFMQWFINNADIGHPHHEVEQYIDAYQCVSGLTRRLFHSYQEMLFANEKQEMKDATVSLFPNKAD